MDSSKLIDQVLEGKEVAQVVNEVGTETNNPVDMKVAGIMMTITNIISGLKTVEGQLRLISKYKSGKHDVGYYVDNTIDNMNEVSGLLDSIKTDLNSLKK